MFYSFGRKGGNFISNVANKNPWLIKRRYFPCLDSQRWGNCGFCVGWPYRGVCGVESKARRGNKRNFSILCIPRYSPGYISPVGIGNPPLLWYS